MACWIVLLVAVARWATPPATDELDAVRSRHALRVVVVDADGRPLAGVPVSRSSHGVLDPDPGQVVVTDAAGLATFLPDPPEQFRGGAPQTAWLAFPNIDGARVIVPVGGSTMSETLVAPPSTSLEIEVVDERGARVVRDGELRISLVGGQGELARSGVAPIVDGLAHFERIGRASSLYVHGRVGGRKIAMAASNQAHFLLPWNAPGLRLKVELEAPGPTLRGRLLRPDGAPASGIPVDVFEEHPASHSQCGPRRPFDRILADSDGRFAVELPTESGSCSVITFAVADGFGGYARAAPLRLEGIAIEDRNIEVGDVRLEDATLLAQGRVVDEHGEELGDLELTASIEDRKDDGLGLEDETPEAALAFLPRSQRTRSDGRFEFRAFLVDSGTRVRLHPDHLVVGMSWDRPSPELTVGLGARDVLLRLQRNGSIVTNLLLPAGVAPSTVACLMLRPDVKIEQWSNPVFARAWCDDIVLARLLPIEQDLVVIATNAVPSRTQIERITGIVVPSGGVCGDPRLAAIDLRDRLVLHELSIVDGAGRAAASGVVRELPLDPRRPGLELPIVDGLCVVPMVRALASQVRVEVDVPGSMPRTLAADQLDAPVILEASPVLEVVAGAAPDGVMFELEFHRTPTQEELDLDSTARPRKVTASLRPGATIAVALTGRGRWKCRPTASLDAGGRDPRSATGPSCVVFVPEDRAPEPLRIELSAWQLDWLSRR